MIADDDAETRQLVGVQLRGIAQVVGIAAAWDDAIQIVAERHPAVLVVDESMPDGHGSLRDRIAAVRTASPETAVVVYSAGSDASEAFDSGAVSFVRKPATSAELRAAVLSAASD